MLGIEKVPVPVSALPKPAPARKIKQAKAAAIPQRSYSLRSCASHACDAQTEARHLHAVLQHVAALLRRLLIEDATFFDEIFLLLIPHQHPEHHLRSAYCRHLMWSAFVRVLALSHNSV